MSLNCTPGGPSRPRGAHAHGVLCSRGLIVPDGVVRSETDPLRNGAVLLLRLGELLLGAERLVALVVANTLLSAPRLRNSNHMPHFAPSAFEHPYG